MFKYLLYFSLILFSVNLTAQSHDSDPLQEPPVSESIDEALEELSGLFEGNTLDSIFGEFGGAFGEFKMDSLDLTEIMGGDQFSELFGEIDMTQLNEMMEQSMKMLEGVDLEEMMKSIDMSEIMKMFEGIDIEGFENLTPTPQNPEAPSKKEHKKLKKI